MKNWKKVCGIIGIFAIGIVLALNFVHNTENFAFAQSPSITILTLTSNNTLLGGGEYSITPDPFGNSETYTIKDNSAGDSEKDKDGVILITGVKNENYTISQITAPAGYDLDRLSKIIQVKDSSVVASFTNIPTGSNVITNSVTNSVTNISYTAKFECGSIVGGEGPLRPGHYDTDISIFNKQKFQTSILWNVVVNDRPTSNAILKKLDSETSSSITCDQIRKTIDNNDTNFIEGFVIVSVPLDSMLESNSTILNLSGNDINLLDVQVFYTANSLETLPHEIVIDKISFYIIQDGTGKIPQEMMRKTLDISVPSDLNELSNTEDKVKSILAQKYNLTDSDLEKVVVRIKDVNVGVGALIDDHAISLTTVKPQASS